MSVCLLSFRANFSSHTVCGSHKFCDPQNCLWFSFYLCSPHRFAMDFNLNDWLQSAYACLQFLKWSFNQNVLSCWYHFFNSCLLFLLAVFQSLSLFMVSSYWNLSALSYSLLIWVRILISYRLLWDLTWD